VDVKLLPESTTDKLSEVGATTVQVDLDDRLKRPYPPSEVTLDGSVYPLGTVSLDTQQGSTEDTKGMRLQFVRRDFRTTNEVTAQEDEDGLPSDFPSNNSTEYEILVRNDPDGANTLLFTIAYGTATNDTDVLRTKILKALDGVIPSRLRVDVNVRHTYLPDATQYTSREPLRHDFDVASSQLSGMDNQGTLDTNEVGSITATDTGTYSFSIGTNLLSSGVLEAQINGGGYVTVISSGTTSGTLAGVTAGDTIDFRHTQTGSGTTETLLLVSDNSATDIAYAILDI
jgi:hypothetical protein